MIYALPRGFKLYKLEQVSRDFCLHVYSVHFNVSYLEFVQFKLFSGHVLPLQSFIVLKKNVASNVLVGATIEPIKVSNIEEMRQNFQRLKSLGKICNVF